MDKGKRIILPEGLKAGLKAVKIILKFAGFHGTICHIQMIC